MKFVSSVFPTIELETAPKISTTVKTDLWLVFFLGRIMIKMEGQNRIGNAQMAATFTPH